MEEAWDERLAFEKRSLLSQGILLDEKNLWYFQHQWLCLPLIKCLQPSVQFHPVPAVFRQLFHSLRSFFHREKNNMDSIYSTHKTQLEGDGAFTPRSIYIGFPRDIYTAVQDALLINNLLGAGMLGTTCIVYTWSSELLSWSGVPMSSCA